MQVPPQDQIPLSDEELDRDGRDSFPASDPPSHWPGPDLSPPSR
jgi:hypothetical protein